MNELGLKKSLKKVGKNILCFILEYQVKRLRSKYNFKVIAIVGSVGKTGTKLAIARMLSVKYKVRYQLGNYNDRLTVPLVIFGHQQPDHFDLKTWFKIFYENQRQINGPFPHEFIVLELGTDRPGQIQQFGYLKPDLGVLTGIAAEHMELFKTLDAVAFEELSIASYSHEMLVNLDITPKPYLKNLKFEGYGVDETAQYRLTGLDQHDDLSQTVSLQLKGETAPIVENIKLLGVQGAKTVLAATAVAKKFGMDIEAIKKGLSSQTPFSGRMQPLKGANNSLIIDDTYNSSPTSALAALQTLYGIRAPQRIAILGSMNELGLFSKEAHEQVGKFCDPAQLDYLITIGKEASDYLAPAAQASGCPVKTFSNPYEAANFAKNLIKPEAVILIKGSQNGVFAEEAVKLLLAEEADNVKLVRQSKHWINQKKKQFAEFFPEEKPEETEFHRIKNQPKDSK